MQPVLVTGSSGRIGKCIAVALEQRGDEVRRFDLATGDDLLDERAVTAAAAGCRAIVHAGALSHDTAGTPMEIEATNVGGTRVVLEAGERAGVERLVFFSSVQVFGFWDGEGEPAYLPVDDSHPRLAGRPYGRSKRVGEDLCEVWSTRTGIPSIALRPVLVVDDADVAVVRRDHLAMDAFVHVEDVVTAVLAALTVELPAHTRARS